MTLSDFLTGTDAPWWYGVVTALLGGFATYLVTSRGEKRATATAAAIRAEQRTESELQSNRGALLADVKAMLATTEEFINALTLLYIGNLPPKGFPIEDFERVIKVQKQAFDSIDRNRDLSS